MTIHRTTPKRTCTVDGCERPYRGRGLCQTHGMRLRRTGSLERVRRDYTATPNCDVGGCEHPPRHAGLCNMHYSRRNRDEGLGPSGRLIREFGRGHINDEGYHLVVAHGHPLATSQGRALAHRIVLFDAIGGGSHPCHWCSTPVAWLVGTINAVTPDALTVDHLNGDREDNRIANLVPSCMSCNTRRANRQRKDGVA